MKPPAFVSDLIADLRDRGLLPVAIGLLVAIVAVPILLSKGGEEPPAETSSSAELAGGGEVADPEPVILASTSEIRAYRERLKAFNEKDPFRPGITEDEAAAAAAAADQSSNGPAGAGGVSSTGEVTAPDGGTASGGTGDSSGGSTSPTGGSPTTPPADDPAPPDPEPNDPPPAEGKVFMPVVDVETGPAGKARRQNGVTVGEYLPGPVDPFAQYFEGAFSATAATFLITPTARAVKGDGKCRPKRGLCRALTLQEGDTAYVIDSTDGVRYKLELIAIRLVEIDPEDLKPLDVKPGFDDAKPNKVELMPATAVG